MKRIVLISVFVILVALIGIGVRAAENMNTYLPIVMMSPPTPTPTLTPTPIPTPQLLPNGDFEQGRTVWHEYSNHPYAIIRKKGDGLPINPYSGSWAAWMGGANNQTDTLDQTVTVPTNLPYLAYWRWLDSTDFCGYDTVKVKINNTSIEDFSLCKTGNTNGWVKKIYDLRSYAGKSITLKFAVTTDANNISSLYLDYFVFQWNNVASDPVPGMKIDSNLVPSKLDYPNK